MRVYLAQVVALLGVATPLRAQAPPDSLQSDAEAGHPVTFDTVAAAARYRKSWLHTALVGSGYRRQWATPIPVEVLDLHRYAGGLRAVRRGGGMQTAALHLEAADGRNFDFRSVDKDGTATLPPELRRSIVGRSWQDQVSASYPAGALVAPTLLDAVGVLTSRPRLFVMPDDPELGKFRKDFAGMLGTLEERPSSHPGEHSPFHGVRKIANTDELYERLTRRPKEQVDSRAFLAARLMDVYIGDADRGEQQWRWLKLRDADGAPWEPLPYDRDYIFVRFRGLLPSIVRVHDPRLVDFRDRYPSMFGLNWRARFIDRRLLGGLDWATWDSVAHELTTRLTDSVIDLAIRQLPPRYAAEDGSWLARSLQRRRDQLPEAARRLYDMIALEAEVYATDASETVVATRGTKGTLDLAIFARDEAPGDHPYFHRRFDAKTTKEVRLFLNAGADSVLVRGTGGGPRLRVIAGGQAKVVSDEGGRTNVYGPQRSVSVGGLHPPSVDHRPYRPPDSTSDVPAAPRDWGHWWTLSPWTGASTEQGTVLGLGVSRYGYGFRRNPYAFRLDLRTGYAVNASAFAAEIRADLRQQNSATHFLLRGLALQGDNRRFFGFGNQTPFTASNTFYRTFQHQYLVSAAVGWSLARHLTARAGPVLKYSTSSFNRVTLLSEVRPYGSGRFGELGAEAAVALDSRDTVAAPARGVHVIVGGSLYPALWDVTSTFGEVHGEAATYLSAPLPLEPTLALRVGGKRVWGTHPFQEGAYIGGGTTVRGLYTGRFLGDASAFGNAELRLRLTSFDIFAPGEMGVFGLGDVGRVWLTGESSNKWHTAFGGGLWFAYLNRRNTISAAMAHGDGRTTVYLRTGFMF